MNKKTKRIIKISGVVLGAFIIFYLAMIGPELWKSYKWQKAVDDYEEAMRKPYKEDIYGGKTPEETWSMFLDALKKGDIDLASKYYDVEHQSNAKQWLDGLKQKNELAQTIKEMEKLRKSESQPLSKDKIYYSYDFFSDQYKQTLTGRIVFYLNPYTKVWKIIY